nr:hypothetical protein [uncultured Dongia sp.]
MGVAGGIFNIIQRGQLYATAASLRATTQTGNNSGNNRQAAKSQNETSTDPRTWSLKANESAAASYWRLAPDSAAKNAPTLDMVKRLEKMADNNNSDISAEKMRQAKAKLDGLRRQLQMLAATGDVRQLRRIAAEAASLAREIGAAARSIAQGIGAGSVSSDASSAQATASAANAAAQSTPGKTALEGTAPDSGGIDSPTVAAGAAAGSTLEQSYKALHDLGTDARNAVVQAKGIIALAAQIARAKRRGGDEEEDRYFRRLQEEADGALHDIDAGQREALGELILPQNDSVASSLGASSLDGGVLTSTSLEITVETLVISQTSVEVYA